MSDTGYAMEPPTDKPKPAMEDDSLYETPHFTWGEFKKQVEAAGVTNDMEVSYIDWDDGHGVQVSIHPGSKSCNIT